MVIDPLIEVATPAHRDTVVATVVAAFADDPAFRFFCPDDATYPADAAVLAGRFFDERVGHGTVWVADGGAAVAMWDDPSVPRGEERPKSRMSVYDEVVHRALPVEPHWYLGVLASHPRHRGRRLGRAVMVPGLAAARQAGLPSVLETANPGNVEVYRSVGFDVYAEVTVEDLKVWIMRRPAG